VEPGLVLDASPRVIERHVSDSNFVHSSHDGREGRTRVLAWLPFHQPLADISLKSPQKLQVQHLSPFPKCLLLTVHAFQRFSRPHWYPSLFPICTSTQHRLSFRSASLLGVLVGYVSSKKTLYALRIHSPLLLLSPCRKLRTLRRWSLTTGPHTGTPLIHYESDTVLMSTSNSRRSPQTHSRNSRSRRTGRRSYRTTAHIEHRNIVNGGGVDYIDSHVNGETYDSAFTYAMFPPEQPGRVPSEAYCPESQYYYNSAQFQGNEPTMYDNELNIDEEQPLAAPAQTQQYASYPSRDHHLQQMQTDSYPHALDQGSYRPQTPVQNGHQNVPPSPTTIRWSAERSPEERLRLGLPRYATEAEVEAERRAYEQAMHGADQSDAPQSG